MGLGEHIRGRRGGRGAPAAYGHTGGKAAVFFVCACRLDSSARERKNNHVPICHPDKAR